MKKILIFIVLIIGNCILDSCCTNENICFDIELTGIKNFNQNGNNEASLLDTIEAVNYAILIEALSIDEICLEGFSFGSNLYATYDCDDDPFFFYQNKVTGISIKSNSNLSLNYLSGSELKELFKPIEFDKSCLGNIDRSHDCYRDYSLFEGIDSLEDAFNELMSVNFYGQNDGTGGRENLNLFSLNTEELIIQNKHELKVKFDFESGGSIEFKTDEIFIK